MTIAPVSELCSSPVIHTRRVAAARSRLPNADQANTLAELYKLFADPTRLRILSALEVDELCVCDLSACLEMTQSAISHQLATLKRARLVRSRREGKVIFYTLDDEHVRAVLDLARAHVAEGKR